MLYETLEVQDTFCQRNTCTCPYEYASSSIIMIAKYAVYGKFSILVKALPKLVLYRKYGTQRVVLRQI